MQLIQKLISDHLNVWTSSEAEKKSSRGRSNSNAGKIYGIQKLRELILNLAIQGRLIPGSSNEEPSIENPKDIAKEIPFKIPKNWRWVYLPEIASYKVGKTPSTKNSSYWSISADGYSWVSIADLNDKGTVNRTSKNVTELAQKEVIKSKPTEAGSILMSFKLTIGKISILEMPAYHNEAIISIYPSKFINKDFLFKFLPSRASAGNSKSAIKGNTLNSESLAALLIPLPPLSEQLRIVSKVDELMALCDQLEQQHINSEEAHEKLVKVLLETLTQSKDAEEFKDSWQRIADHFDTLFTTEDSIDDLKQALLQLAVMGKLVPQDSSDESSNELLRRAETEKTKLVNEGKLKKQKQYKNINTDDYQFKLPLGWAFGLLPQVVKNDKYSIKRGPFGSSIKKDFFVKSGYKIYEQQHAIQDNFSLGTYYINKDKFEELKAFQVKPQDIIISCSGTVGKVAIAPENMEPGIINQALLKITLNESVLLNLYFKILFPAYFMKTDKLSDLSGTAQKNIISVDELKNEAFPLPPLNEQYRIVKKVGELMTLCDELKSRIQQASAKQKQIADVLVSQALH